MASMVLAFAQSGDAQVQQKATRILSSVVRPLLAMIRAWMSEGELQDPFGEFFVVATSVPIQDLWTHMCFGGLHKGAIMPLLVSRPMLE